MVYRAGGGIGIVSSGGPTSTSAPTVPIARF